MVENNFVNTKLSTTTVAVFFSYFEAQKDSVKMLGWIEVHIFQNLNEIPELAFLRVIRGLDFNGRAI